MKRISVAAAVALLAPSLALAGSNNATSAADLLLFGAISAQSSVSYTGVVEVVRIGGHAAEASVYRIEHRPPDLTRRDYTSPSTLSGDSVISRGEVSYSIDARRHRVVESRNGAIDDRIAINDNYALLRQNYQLDQNPDEVFDGRRCSVLALANKYNHRETMLLRIDRETKLVLDKQEFARDGSLRGEVRFERIGYTTAIPAADFSLPKQYQVVQGPTFGRPPQDPQAAVRDAGFVARTPRTLPEGFAPVEGSVVELKGIRTLHLLYSDGIRTVSLFENATASTLDMAGLQQQWISIGPRRAQYAEAGAMGLLAWSDAGLHYALVGELGLPELRQIAASITP